MPRDFWIGLAGLCLAVVYWLAADRIRISPLDDPVTAAGLPKALGVALGVLAVAMIARSLAERALRPPAAPVEAAAPAAPLGERLRPHLRAAGVLAIGVAYLLLVPYLGYALGISALMLSVSMYIGAPLGVRTLVIAALGGVVFHLLFVELLGIPLPEGALLSHLLGALS